MKNAFFKLVDVMQNRDRLFRPYYNGENDALEDTGDCNLISAIVESDCFIRNEIINILGFTTKDGYTYTDSYGYVWESGYILESKYVIENIVTPRNSYDYPREYFEKLYEFFVEKVSLESKKKHRDEIFEMWQKYCLHDGDEDCDDDDYEDEE